MIGTMPDPEKYTELYSIDESRPHVDTAIPGASTSVSLILPTVMKRKDIFKVSVIEPRDVVINGINEAALKSGPSQSFPAHDSETFVYPYALSVTLKSKYSVTELNRARSAEEPVHEYETPFFFMSGGNDETAEDAGLSKREKGIALHTALELLEIKEAYERRDEARWFSEFLEKLYGSGVLSKEEMDSIDSLALQEFAKSNLAARAAASGFVLKETPFNMKQPCDADGEIVVQGVIDLLFEEEDGIVIVDYKSGWFDLSSYESETERLRSAYGKQLLLYKRAAELIFEKPVTESLIYMTQSGVVVGIR
jgi:ATP-dependent helicase/nuclease subunit A